MKMSRTEVCRLGALARIKKHGNPGTTMGRSRGGINSCLKQAKLENNFKTAKECSEPEDSEILAEFMGILIGDGHLSDYQVSITTNSETDLKHAFYIKKIIKKIFAVEAVMVFRKLQKAVNIITSSVKLVRWLESKGMPKGNKLDKGLGLPEWIKKDKKFIRGFLRGLFDTDGCVYVDNHRIKGRLYRSLGWNITSYSARLRDDVFGVLLYLGYHPTSAKTQKAVYMRKRRDIEKYFKDIGTNNPKHLERYKKGRVPKRS